MVRLPPNDADYNDYSQKSRDEAHRNLQILGVGVVAWNAHFATLQKPAKLGALSLAKFELIGAHFRNADMRGIDLSGANLSGSDLSGADLRGARLQGAYLYGATLQNANLLEARFENACLERTNLRDTSLFDAHLENANLRSADLHGAFLFRANLAGADLDGARGIVLDSTHIRGARLPITHPDPWSALRRHFTGSAMVFNLLLVAAFLFPLAIKAAFWMQVNALQVASGPTISKLGLPPCLAATCESRSLWEVVLGFGRSPLYVFATLALLVYNSVRLLLTVRIAPLRDEEERSGFSPRYWPTHEHPYKAVDPLPSGGPRERVSAYMDRLFQSYGWMIGPYKLMRVLIWVALALLAWHLWQWLQIRVYLPVR